MAAPAVPLVAVAPAKQRLDCSLVPAIAAIAEATFHIAPPLPEIAARAMFAPLETIQLRI